MACAFKAIKVRGFVKKRNKAERQTAAKLNKLAVNHKRSKETVRFKTYNKAPANAMSSHRQPQIAMSYITTLHGGLGDLRTITQSPSVSACAATPHHEAEPRGRTVTR